VLEQKRQFRFFTITRVLAAAILGWLGAHYFPVQRFLSPQQEATKVDFFPVKSIVEPKLAAASSSPFGHPYYRYSVIPGGAHSRAELEAALERDPVAAKHYSDFRAGDTQLVRLDKDRQYFVSYRIGDKVYWTRRALTLHKGELLLFDGVHYARARCGNRLSERIASPQIETASAEPEPKIFNAPAAVQMSLAQQVPQLDPAPNLPFEISRTRIEGLPDPLASLAEPYMASDVADAAGSDAGETVDYVPIRHDRVTLFANDSTSPMAMLPIFFPTETPPVSSVPEPSTTALASLALLFAGGLVWWQKKRHRLVR
jgi:hypothetical protein